MLSGEVDIRYIPTAHQIADIFTKGFTRERFCYPCDKLQLVASPQFSLRGNDKPISMVSYKVSLRKNAQLKSGSQYHSTSTHDHEQSSPTDNRTMTNQDWWLEFG